ncbi:MAG: hypothetical protein QOG68_336 [Solirubrobacteraceae bacterium]|nr:hypothetical protein [Solirubrobacteraceae bacterium]
MAFYLKTSADIDASPDRVWEILADLPSYATWNPLITEAAGELATGERLELWLQPIAGKGMRIKPTVTVAEPARELRWLGRLGVRGVFDGEHRFVLEPTATGTHLEHEERFTGVLVPFMARRLRARVLPAFELMNRALAARAEAVCTELAA